MQGKYEGEYVNRDNATENGHNNMCSVAPRFENITSHNSGPNMDSKDSQPNGRTCWSSQLEQTEGDKRDFDRVVGHPVHSSQR